MKKSNYLLKRGQKIKTVCPYCKKEVEIDPHRGCCGEIHHEVIVVDKNGFEVEQ